MLKNVINLNTIENNTDEVRSQNSPSTEPKLKQKLSGPLLYHIKPNIKFSGSNWLKNRLLIIDSITLVVRQ